MLGSEIMECFLNLMIFAMSVCYAGGLGSTIETSASVEEMWLDLCQTTACDMAQVLEPGYTAVAQLSSVGT